MALPILNGLWKKKVLEFWNIATANHIAAGWGSREKFLFTNISTCRKSYAADQWADQAGQLPKTTHLLCPKIMRE